MNEINQLWDIILASASPRRAALLSGMGVVFRTHTLDTDEAADSIVNPREVAAVLAERKADAFPLDQMTERSLLITADTIVVKNNTILGKPKNSQEAMATLMTLSNARHEVITSIHLRSQHARQTFSVSTAVWFKELRQDDILYYIDHFKPYDKAGAYGIQEWIGYTGIYRIEGCYNNVVGLPTSRLYDELIRFSEIEAVRRK